MAYATYTDVETRLGTTFTETEQSICTSLLDEAAAMIDSYRAATDKSDDIKKIVSVSMVSRNMANLSMGMPVGATQGSMGAGGYNQSFTIGSGGSVGTLYFDKHERKLLGIGNQMGSYSPVEGICEND